MKTGFQFVEVVGQFMHRCVILSHDVLVFKLLFACLASNINYVLRRLTKTWQQPKMVTYIATTRQKDKETAITELGLGV